jgi:SAM-dependent methyltransferase
MEMREKEIKKVVREGYAKIAKQEGTCCAPVNPCCGSLDSQEISKKVGYTEDDLNAVPDGANLGLGCGNPVALASLKEGEVVLDLGSGAGFDCFLAANRVGKTGRIIGVDMTPEMIEKARRNAQKTGYENVEFRLGEIENLPVADNSVDIVISNCVINLVPDKKRAFQEMFRVLKPGGRMMISDLILLKELPSVVKESIGAYIGCLSGAILKEEYMGAIKDAGFTEIRIIDEATFPVDYMANDPTAQTFSKSFNIPRESIREVLSSVVSIKVSGIKV